MDVLLLSRIQFAFTIAFHYLFPPLSIGLGLMLIIFEGMYIKTKNTFYKEITRFWMGIFALTFALGVASGLVQVFAFGNNWARFSKFVGDVFGSALAAEGIFAFFLEAGFLGVMLFGWDRVSKKVHYLSTILVALGAHFSAIWIVVANSWMQTPAGSRIEGEGENARAVITSFWEMVFNPSSMDRLLHVIVGCWLAGSFLVLSVSAYYFLRKRHLDFARTSMKIGLIVAGIAVVLQLISADISARGVAKNQPEKFAALEGVYQTKEYTPMTAIGYVDAKSQKVKGLKIPGLLSFLTYRNAKKSVPGLEQFPKSDWPNVPFVFQFYHIMILVWGLMFLVTFFAIIFFMRKKIDTSKWTLRALVLSFLLPQIGNQTGWFTAEMGRQPWVVYKLLRTSKAVSTVISVGQVIGSLVMFFVVYSFLFTLFIYMLNKKIQHGPAEIGEAPPEEDKVYAKGGIS